MAKSNYPTALDTSKELPPVRDNITEIGSEVINSLRSAIINIEKTLGINPQGSIGNTLASRINTSLDETGNIRKEALTKANILSGPITDVDVATAAAISEKKLRLQFPTQVLQDQISILNRELDSIESQIKEISASLSAHIHPDALGRHKAAAINVSSATVSEASTAFDSLDEIDTLQNVLEAIVNGHINFAGSVSSGNNSHSADQIYFDTTEVDDVIFQDDLQGAMEDLANLESVGLRRNTLNLASNGRIRTGEVVDLYEENNLSDLLVGSADVTYTREGSRTRFTFDEVQTPVNTIVIFDYLTMSGSDTADDNKSYQIAEIVKSGSDISALIVFGVPLGDSTSGLSAIVSKNPYVTYNKNGLNGTVRPRADKTNTPDIFVANPNAATVISTKAQPSKIVEGTSTFDISVDGSAAVTITTYDSNVSEQTLESIINKINEQCVDQNLNFLAYKIKANNCNELALTHILPNLEDDVINRTLKVSVGSSTDGAEELGFNSVLEATFEGSGRNAYHINGLVLDTFGRVMQFEVADIEIVTGTNTVNLLSGTFGEKGIRVGDLAVISRSSDSDDHGTYRISNVKDAIITLDSSTLEFEGILGVDGAIHIVRASAPISELNFTEIVSVDGSIVFDTFITDDKDVHYHKRLEVDGAVSSGGFSSTVIDISKNFIKTGETATISVTTTGFAQLTDTSLELGPSIYVGQTGVYRLLANDGLSYVTIAVNSTGLPSTAQSVTLHGFNELTTNNYRICRGTFATSLGRVLGEYSGVGIPSVIDKRRSGTVDETIVSESLLEKYIEGPRNELRAHGIIRGLAVSNVVLVDSGNTDGSGNIIYYHEVDIDAGVALVNGIRYELPGYSSFRINSGADFYIAVDAFGCIFPGEQITNPDGYTDGYTDEIAPFADQDLAYLAFINSDLSTATDLRFFVDRLDLKAGRIIVSKTQNFGHFTDVSSAISYASKFTEMYPNQGTPTVFIDQGDYEISSTILVDFDIKICGAGPDTVLKRTGTFAEGTPPVAGNPDFGDALFLVGTTSETGSARIMNGVTFSDFTYLSSEDLDAVACVISIIQPLIKAGENASETATYRVQDINFLGPEDINFGTGTDSELIGEYAIALGQSDENDFAPISDITMGNLMVTGCRFDRMGVEYGAIIFSDSSSSTFQNVVVSNNIGTRLSPTAAITTFELIELPASPTLTNIIQSNNATNI